MELHCYLRRAGHREDWIGELARVTGVPEAYGLNGKDIENTTA